MKAGTHLYTNLRGYTFNITVEKYRCGEPPRRNNLLALRKAEIFRFNKYPPCRMGLQPLLVQAGLLVLLPDSLGSRRRMIPVPLSQKETPP